MGRAFMIAGAVAMVIATAPFLSAQRGQAGSGGPATEARSPRPSAGHASSTPPRTPWGDPNLQGDFTNKYEQSTPFERPAEFEGRHVEEVTGAELAEVLKKREQQVLARPQGVGPNQFRDLLDVTKGSRAWLIVDPPDGKIPPLTAESKRRTTSAEAPLDVVNARRRTGSSFGDGPFDGPEDLSLFDRCITRGHPGSMVPFIHGNSYQIVQTPGFVAIRYEIMHETRVIPLDGRPHIARGIRLDMGDPRGHWEGSTLVVVTTNFTERSAYRNANGDTLRIVERFIPMARDQIEWAVTIDDPATWTRPWTFAMRLTRNDSEPVLEFACHEGNYAVANILSAARAADRAAIAGK